MSTVHLTPEEKKELKASKDARRRNLQLMHARRKQEKEQLRIDAERVRIEMARSQNPDIVKFLGPTVDIDQKIFAPDVELNAFIENLAKQPLFLETVAEEIDNPKVARFLKYVGELQHRSMTDCAKMAGLTKTDLAQIWRDTKVNRAFFRIVNRIEEQVDKVVDDAIGKKKACRRCDGLKRIDVPENMREFFNGHETAICPECDGAGFILATGSAQHAQLVWEKLGWTKGKGGISVNLNMGDHMADATMNELDGIEGQIVDVQANQ